MYALINSSIEMLMRGISRIEHVQPYVDICELFSEGKSSSKDFRFKYRKFFQLNAARLSEEFCSRYFALLEQNRSNEEVDPFNIVETLYEIPSNSKGTNAVHFSFATKLVHTIDRNRPIYDSMVAAFYFFPEIKPTWGKDKKISEYKQVYSFLGKEYARVLEQRLLADSIQAFRQKFALGQSYSDIKVIDTLIWRYTAYLKAGALRDGRIRYG
jgi:hypothetical protein